MFPFPDKISAFSFWSCFFTEVHLSLNILKFFTVTSKCFPLFISTLSQSWSRSHSLRAVLISGCPITSIWSPLSPCVSVPSLCAIGWTLILWLQFPDSILTSSVLLEVWDSGIFTYLAGPEPEPRGWCCSRYWYQKPWVQEARDLHLLCD